MATAEERALLRKWFDCVRFPPRARARIEKEFEEHADEIVERIRERLQRLDRSKPVLIIDQGRSGRFTRAMLVPLLRLWGYDVGFTHNGLKILALRSQYRPRSIRFNGKDDPRLKHEFLAEKAMTDPLWRKAIALMREGKVQPIVVDTFKGRGVTLDTVKGTLAQLLGVSPDEIPHFLIAESKDDPLWDAARIMDHYSKREFSDSDRWYKLNYVDAESRWRGMRVTYEKAHVNRLQSQEFKEHIPRKYAHDSH